MSLSGPSELGRVAGCVRSETLERVEEVTEPAAMGTVGHHFLKNVREVGLDAALMAEAAEDREWLRGIRAEELPAFHPDQYAAEVSFAYNPSTGKARELGRGLGRAEARALALHTELVGTADVAGIAPEGVVIHDYKMGFGWVDPASQNWQVKTYVLMAARAWDRDAGVGGIIRARPDGFVHFDSTHMDLFALEEHEAQLRELLSYRAMVLEDARAGRPLPPFVEGPWCRYCPARRICPPKTAQLLALAREASPVVSADGHPVELSRLLTDTATPDRLGDDAAALVWERIKFASKMVDRLKAEVQEYARRSAIPLGGGWVLGERHKTTEKIIPELAVPILEQIYGVELATVIIRAAMEGGTSMTQTALSAALSRFVLPLRAGAKLSRVKAEVMQRLREGGAVSAKVSRTVEEHKVSAPKALKPLEPGADSEEAAA